MQLTNCPDCDGTGTYDEYDNDLKVYFPSQCNTCKGTEKVEEPETDFIEPPIFYHEVDKIYVPRNNMKNLDVLTRHLFGE